MRKLITPDLGGVIFAASASRKDEAKKSSGTKQVDRDGVVTCAELCIESSVPRYVIVSSGGVSKPKSAVYLFLNLAASGIMDAKIAGEDKVRALYAAPGVAGRNVGYTVVRPGGLTKEVGLGVGAVELNQGDDKSGRIARADVAAICIESLASPAAFDTTFEVRVPKRTHIRNARIRSSPRTSYCAQTTRCVPTVLLCRHGQEFGRSVCLECKGLDGPDALRLGQGAPRRHVAQAL